jgi:NADPH:quinone reductase-like Zn-dependent oxidoreductase
MPPATPDPVSSDPSDDQSTVTDTGATTMHAVVQDVYGPPSVLEYRETERPTPEATQILVRVRAAAANPLDWHEMRANPVFMRLISGLRTPTNGVRGVDVAGVVEAVGADVTRFRPGDEVFGVCEGAFAEYAVGNEDRFARKPDALTFEQAAAVPIAGVTALQALVDHGRLQSGQRVLVNGASGGVGTFAVQLAAALGAEVTGVCSTRNLDLVRSLGADHVVDYTETDFAREAARYDLVVDLVGNRSLADLRRVLTPEGTLVLVGAPEGTLGMLRTFVPAVVLSPFVDHRLRPFITDVDADALSTLVEYIEDGTVSPVVDRTYPLSETAAAIRYLETGRARGKVVVTVPDGEN